MRCGLRRRELDAEPSLDALEGLAELLYRRTLGSDRGGAIWKSGDGVGVVGPRCQPVDDQAIDDEEGD
jgi:hypothetical protein